MFSSLALHIKSVRVVRNKAFKIVTIGYNQFGCGISKMVGPKKQGFCPKINCSQMKLPNFVSPSADNCGLSK